MKALDNVSLRFEPGEIHALVGENGAGKSTLIKIVTGIYKPDSGEIRYEGEPLHFNSYRDSLKMGIDLVNQEIQVVPESSIAENIMLDKMITYGKTGVINWKQVNSVAKEYMNLVGLDFSPYKVMKNLSAAHKQLAQIAKALASKARVLLLDEPTSSLTEHEAEKLFDILRGIRDQGVAIIFVSHKFEEVFALCDKATVLRDGQYVDTMDLADLTKDELISMMIGRTCSEDHLGELNIDTTREVLRVEHLCRSKKVDDVSFTLHQGEILGFYGLVGAGRTELARILIGEDKLDSGTVYIRGKKETVKSVAHSLHHHRIGYVTENRKEEGLFLKDPLETNITITVWRRLVGKLSRFINRKKEVDISTRMVDLLQIKTTGLSQPVENLSGGNQQKVSLSKWLAADCDILIIDEPTVGVDVGAKEHIHRLIWDLAGKQNKSLILISSDMPEIVKVASRILVFKDQRIVGEVKDIANKTYEEASAAIGKYLA